MKLVEGRDLEALLQDRPTPTQDLPRFLTIFQQVCQTVAFAHSKQIVHRDLKPLNVMVGAFGEVQVMDWGMAKVLKSTGSTDQDCAYQNSREEKESAGAIVTNRSSDLTLATESGWVGGTPGYMSPEQARGEGSRVGKPSDVFSLGAMLCQILTGRPPYSGGTRAAQERQAQAAAMEQAFIQLEGCGADAALIALAKACLAADPQLRPADAEEVTRDLTRYLDGVQQKLRAVEVERARAEVKVAEEPQEAALASGTDGCSGVRADDRVGSLELVRGRG